MHEKKSRFNHYRDSVSPTAMEHPAFDKNPEDTADLTQPIALGNRAPSDPEITRLIRAFNGAPGSLPYTPDRTLLQHVETGDEQRIDRVANINELDPGSNGIVYLKAEKFIHAVGLAGVVNGRDDLKNGGSSRQVIQKYKNMSPYTMPPVTNVIGYHEHQSGNTYFSLVGDGTHRLAGAILRGDEYIPASSVTFVSLEEDTITQQLVELERRAAEATSATRTRFGGTILRRLGIGTS